MRIDRCRPNLPQRHKKGAETTTRHALPQQISFGYQKLVNVHPVEEANMIVAHPVLRQSVFRDQE